MDKLSNNEKFVLDKIKNLTENGSYATVEIIIVAGSIELVQISEKHKLPEQREQPASGNLVKK